jgi:hypothetical protein
MQVPTVGSNSAGRGSEQAEGETGTAACCAYLDGLIEVEEDARWRGLPGPAHAAAVGRDLASLDEAKRRFERDYLVQLLKMTRHELDPGQFKSSVE